MPIHGNKLSLDGLSAATTTTRAQRPARSQSCASAIAPVVPAHAALTCGRWRVSVFDSEWHQTLRTVG